MKVKSRRDGRALGAPSYRWGLRKMLVKLRLGRTILTVESVDHGKLAHGGLTLGGGVAHGVTSLGSTTSVIGVDLVRLRSEKTS